jgi:hypothetical protein
MDKDRTSLATFQVMESMVKVGPDTTATTNSEKDKDRTSLATFQVM